MAKGFTGVTGLMLKKQAEARKAMKDRHKAERRRSASYGKKGAKAEANRARIAERQAREYKDLTDRQAREREDAVSRVRVQNAGSTWTDIRAAYKTGSILPSDFKAENLRHALLNYHNLQGQERADFEKIVRNLSVSDLKNLGKMYKNVLETWKDSEGYFEAISNEVMQRVRQMGTQSIRNISRMLRQGDSDIDDATVQLAMTAWNFKLKSTRETMEAIGHLI